MKKIKNTMKYASNILIGLLVVFCIYSVICTAIFKQKYVNVFGHTFFVVASGSMTGSIDVNDIVIVKITDNYKVNDIITFSQKDYFVTHRVISIKNDTIITKGDVNNTEDDPISKSDVVGKVVFIVSIKAILQIIGATILISIVIIMFNFEKIFGKYIFKAIAKNETKSEDLSQIDNMNKYSEIVRKVLKIIKKRNEIDLNSSMNEEWVRRLRYVTKFLELIKMKNYDLLYSLVNKYDVSDNKYSSKALPTSLIIKLNNESFMAHITLMFNAIMYQDEEIFLIIFISFKDKVNTFIENMEK